MTIEIKIPTMRKQDRNSEFEVRKNISAFSKSGSNGYEQWRSREQEVLGNILKTRA